MQSQHCTPTLVIRRSLFVVLLTLAACDLLTAPSVATTIRLSPTEVTFDALGDNLRVTATVEDQSGNVMSNDTVTWTASDRGIATVSFSGLVTAVRPGTSIITASASSVTAQPTLVPSRSRSSTRGSLTPGHEQEWRKDVYFILAKPDRVPYGFSIVAHVYRRRSK